MRRSDILSRLGLVLMHRMQFFQALVLVSVFRIVVPEQVDYVIGNSRRSPKCDWFTKIIAA